MRSILPDLNTLKRLTQSLATLDALLCAEFMYRYYAFNAHWHPQMQMASMDNGAGDHYFLLFQPEGAIIKGFAHEHEMTPWRVDPPTLWPGMFDDVPAVFKETFLEEPAFDIPNTTFCYWRTNADTQWRQDTLGLAEGSDPDGARWMLDIFCGEPALYQVYAQDYFERYIPISAIEHVYAHKPLTVELLKSLGCTTPRARLHQDLEEIGYPLS